ncbi:MAG: 1-deoxy-D-xylulose-5-phosphate reductoisomerase [Calditrichaeota bacterium]|nr:1-deoxy-D-xylulose-5-phosphate reductoisomerase [Calditrichota bacterium]
MKKICILGATGSIGTNCLDVVVSQPSEFEVRYLTTYQNVALLLRQAEQFRPQAVAVVHRVKVEQYLPQFRSMGIEVLTGFEGLLEISAREDVDILVNALVGAIGLRPTLNAIQNGCRIALANKETLVLGGQLVMAHAAQSGAEIVPIDSEHSALLQCMVGEQTSEVERIILTASGGPFREKPQDQFSGITVAEALNHPNWDMGQKITIDSATLMNKGLEVIEAHWLFDLPLSRIDVVIHPQSVIHSLVEFTDGSMKAQLGLPDMRVPIQYALTYPRRLPATRPRLNFDTLRELTFEPADLDKFRCLQLCYEALEEGGAAPAVLNASNEEAVSLFLKEKIRFDQIPVIVEDALINCETNSFHGVDELIEYDRQAREYVTSKYDF